MLRIRWLLKKENDSLFLTERISVLLWESCIHKQALLSHYLLKEIALEGTKNHPDTRLHSL